MWGLLTKMWQLMWDGDSKTLLLPWPHVIPLFYHIIYVYKLDFNIQADFNKCDLIIDFQPVFLYELNFMY